MANQIKLKRGSGSNPGTSDLVVGEVALRTDNGTLFTKKDDGNIAEIGAATGVSDGDKGDITVSNSGATFTIDSGVIDNANVASNAAIAGSKISPTFSSQILVHQATAPQIRINTSSSDSSSTRFMFGLATASNQFINGSSSNDSCFSAPSNILFGIGNSRKFRIKSNDVLTDIDFIPSSNDATSLGRTDARWSDLFAVDGNISGNLDVGAGINVTGSVDLSSAESNSSNTAQFILSNLTIGQHQNVGSYRFANASTGSFLFTADNINFTNKNGNKSFLRLSESAVELYHNNVKKAETSSTGFDVTGNISCTGTVDGRDLATDGSKLDGIASGATNVTNTNQLTNGAGFLTSVGTSNISDNNVTFAKLENIPQNRVIGRIASGSGDPTTLTPANIRSMINVEDGATADQSASEILTLIKTVDGSGSGLDADTLDGENSGAYLRSNVADQASGDITFAGGAGAVTIEANSDITFNNGSTWSGNQTKIAHHGGYLYIVGGTNGIAFRESGTNRAFITGSGHFEPGANNTYDLGGSSARWRNVYTSDLVLSNEGSKNDVDGTWGSYTIQEGEESLFLINKRNGKKYKFNLTEVN